MFWGSLSVLLSGVLYGITPLITMFLYNGGLNTITVNFFRYLFVIPVILLLAIINKQSLKIKKEDLYKMIFKVASASIATNLLLAGSYNYINTGTATSLHFLYPVIVIMICVFLYHEKMSKALLSAVILVIIAMGLFIISNIDGDMIGILMAALSSLTYAIYILEIERTRSNRLPPLVFSFYLSLITSISMIFVSFVIEPINITISFDQAFLFGCLGVVTLFAVSLFQFGSKKLGSKLCALLSLSEPITSVIVGIIFLNEALLFNKILGSILIIIAIMIVTYRK